MTHSRTLAKPIPFLLLVAKLEVESKEGECSFPLEEIRRLSRQERYEALKKEPHAAPEIAMSTWEELGP